MLGEPQRIKGVERRDPVKGPRPTEPRGRREGGGERSRSRHPAEAKGVLSRQQGANYYTGAPRSAPIPRLHANRGMRAGGSGKQLLRAHSTSFAGTGMLIHTNWGVVSRELLNTYFQTNM